MNDRLWHENPIINRLAQAAANGRLESQFAASVDTPPNGRDAKQGLAGTEGGAVDAEGSETPGLSSRNPPGSDGEIDV